MVSVTGADPLTLVEDGEGRATIVLGVGASDVDRAAARDLQRYVHMMSGARLPLLETDDPPAGPAVLVGRSAAVVKRVGPLLNEQHLGGNGFILKTFPRRLLVVGYQAHASAYPYHGTRYAAFALLEELGCRFFNPNPDGEHVPRHKTIVVGDLNIVSKPDFAYRDLWLNGFVRPALTEKTRQAWRSWMMKNRLGWVSRIRHGHAYDQWCPTNRYFDATPEYFSYTRAKGRRIPMTAQEGQLCLSNPDVVELAAAAARRAFQDPTERSFSLSPNDTEDWCECARCRAMDDPDPAIGLATRVLQFTNQVAAEASRTHPGRLFPYLGEYGVLPGPPVRGDGTVVLKAHPAVVNVIVMGKRFCLLHGINDADCPNNALYRRRLGAWRRVVQKLLIYEWIEPGSRLSTPQTWLIGPRIRYYRDLGGVEGFSGEVMGRSPDNDLTMYIAARMLWDADQDPDVLVQEYFDLYFQEVAGSMRDYYLALNRVGRSPDVHRYLLVFEAFTPQVFAELYPHLDRARDGARQAIVQRRVQRERDALRSYELFMEAHDRCATWERQSTPESRQEGLRALQEANAFLDRIADDDIVNEAQMRSRLASVRRRLGESGAPVANVSAAAGALDLDGATLTLDLGQGVSLKLMRIPAGAFTMGSPPTEHLRDHDEGPLRQVTIRRPFHMGAQEVTQGQFRLLTGHNPSRFGSFAPSHPVENVHWEEAVDFCRALGRRIGRPVRLPTEAEWEYACRAGTTTPFHSGETIGTDEANYNGRGVYGSGRKGSYCGITVPAGSFAPNAWGLYDMHGNVSEWCGDYYAGTYEDGDALDPQGPRSGRHRVVRGGSWRDLPWRCRSAYRFRNHGGSRLADTGFRVVVPSRAD